jgi:hypothetical protein
MERNAKVAPGLTVDVVAVSPKFRPRISPQKRRKYMMPLSTDKTSSIEVEILYIRRYNGPQPSVNGGFIRGRRHRGHKSPA